MVKDANVSYKTVNWIFFSFERLWKWLKQLLNF